MTFTHQLVIDSFHFFYFVLQRLLLQDEVLELHEGLADAQHHPGTILRRHLLEAALLETTYLNCDRSL